MTISLRTLYSIDLTILRTGLISWWDLEEISGNRLDSHSSNHLTPADVNYRSYSSTSNPNLQSSLSVNSNLSLQLSSKDFTICCRVSFNQSPVINNGYFFIFSKDNISTNGREWTLYLTSNNDPTPNRLTWAVYNKDAGGLVDTIVANSLGDISLNTFYWIVCKYNKSTRTISIRVNNGITNSKTYNNSITHTNTNSQVRLSSAGTNEYGLSGIITKACIYEKILSREEEDYLWNNGKLRNYHELT